MRIKLYKLVEELGLASKELLAIAKASGVSTASSSSALPRIRPTLCVTLWHG